MIAGMCSGLGGDIIGWKVLGPGGISKTIIGYMLSLASVKVSLDNPLVRLVILAFASALNTIMLSGLYLIVEQGPYIPGSWGMIWQVMGYKIIGDTAAGGLIYIVLDRVFREQIERKRMAISPRVYE